MTNVPRLKEKARALELNEQWREALDLYTRVAEDSPPDGLDISLWNRIGDLNLRLGQAEAAIGAYERAAEAYVEAGLYNNAIALCNKILRTDPERTEAYLRLGQISATQGFLTDARANILIYAERASRAGRVEEAFDALKEFAALAPNDVEIRLQLAEQLDAHGRSEEALEQLHLALGASHAAGRMELEAEVRERILALDPAADVAALEVGLAPAEVADDQVEEDADDEPEGFGLLPTFELGAALPGAEEDAPEVSPQPIELVPTAQVEEPIDAGLMLQEIAHLDGLETTQAEAPAPELVERLVEDPDEEVEPVSPLPLLDHAMEMLDPGSISLPDPEEEPGAYEAEAEDEGAEPLPLIPTWGDVELVAPEAPATPPPPPPPAPPAPPAQPASPSVAREEYVDLASLIFDADEPEPSTRFVVAEEEPSGDEDRDFAEMLQRFRQKVDENIASDDSASHYDLGLAFKDMGLLDEAIAQFQVALRGGANPLATLEVLGECFIEKAQYTLASRVLERALTLPSASDAALIGVFYLYGRAEEELGSRARAIEFYERVLALDIRFRDARSRLVALQREAPPAF
jgi:tetratricopeptide (TPR) repeat protein